MEKQISTAAKYRTWGKMIHVFITSRLEYCNAKNCNQFGMQHLIFYAAYDHTTVLRLTEI